MEEFKRIFTQNSDSQEMHNPDKGNNPIVSHKDIHRLQEEEERVNECSSLDSVDSGITLASDINQTESQSCMPNEKHSIGKNLEDENSEKDPVNIQKCHNSNSNAEPSQSTDFKHAPANVLTNQRSELSTPANLLSKQNVESHQVPANVKVTKIMNDHMASFPTLETIDNESGILHVWFLMIDGLAFSVACCPKTYQPETLDMLFDLLKSIHDVPGICYTYIYYYQIIWQNDNHLICSDITLCY